ncbi:uncharacterized protein [Arachis hypogaea]|uniref:uncharacterized protein isoform X2 n=1 Tax=Arachis hypogaea TaxID=3818 RepID=UPI003B21B269
MRKLPRAFSSTAPLLPRVSPASGRIGSFLATSPASSPSSSSASGSTPSPTSPSRPGPTRRPSSASRWRTASPPQPEQQPPLPTTITTTAITAITLKMCPTLSLDPITVDSDRTLIATGSSDGRRVKMNDSGHGTITSSTNFGISLNSGCLLAVCTSEGHVKVYRPPFCDFCSEWIEVVNVSERLFEYLQCTEFQGTGTPLEFSKDNLVRSWILRDRCLDEVPVHMPHNNNSSSASDDVYDSCLGAAVSPGNLVVATVHCFDVEKLNRMYEGRVLRAAIEYHWIGGLHVDICLNRPVPFYTEELSGLAEKDLTNWGSNIIWSLNQYQCLDRPLVLLDIILALLDFKVSMPRYVEHLLIKWISLSFPGFHTDLPNEKTLLQVSSSLSGVPSRMLHLLNIICRRVMLAQLDADEITRISSEVQNTKGECCSMDEQVTKWIAILGSSERELRERLVGFSFCASQTSKSRPGATPFQTGHWYPVGLAQMEQWIALNNDHVRGELKSIASEVTNEKRCSAVESCSYCSASVPFESPEFGLCQGKTSGSGSNDKRHKLSRCAVSMQVCPSIPLWFCVCCHRVAFRLAPDPLFRMSSSQFDSDFVTKSLSRAVSSKPLCPYCGILLQRRQPDFLVSPLPV